METIDFLVRTWCSTWQMECTRWGCDLNSVSCSTSSSDHIHFFDFVLHLQFYDETSTTIKLKIGQISLHLVTVIKLHVCRFLDWIHTILSKNWVHIQQTTTYNSHVFFQIKKLNRILHKPMHMYANFQITLIIRKYVAKPNEKLYACTHFGSNCLQIL